jgi:hypothetical protein
VLIERIVTQALVGGGSQIVHTVVNKARDPLAGAFEVQARQSLNWVLTFVQNCGTLWSIV